MKTKFFILYITLVASIVTISASNTSVGGIWYIFNSSNLTAEVTFRGADYDSYANEYTGAVTIPSTVTYSGKTYTVSSIGYYAFYKCTALTSVKIPNSVTSIGLSAFSGCTGLKSPIYNSHFFVLMPTSYSGSYTILDGIESILDNAFFGCIALTSINIPNSVTSIGARAFCGCQSLSSITIPNSVKSIGMMAFQGCENLISITIPNSVTSIGMQAFTDCTGLTSVTIGNGVKTIELNAFYGCTGLTSINIPSSVTSIGVRAFYNCSSLTTIYNRATSPQSTSSDSFTGVNQSSCTLYVPCGSLTAYQSANIWKNFSPIVEMDCPTYTITTSATNGTVTGGGTYDKNASVTLTATPNECYQFVRWSDNNTDNPRTIIVTDDATYTAIFDKIKYTINTESDDHAQGTATVE